MEPSGSPLALGLAPVRTSSGPHQALKVVGFDTSPASVLRFQEDAQTPSPVGQRQRGSLTRALSQHALPTAPRLTINTRRQSSGGQTKLKKCKSHADLQPCQPQPITHNATQPSSPATSTTSQSSYGPVRIPLELSRARTWTETDDLDHEVRIAEAVVSASSSMTSHLPTHSPVKQASSCRKLFEAQADVVTAQAQIQGLRMALNREQEEVVRLREQLSQVTAERDRLLAELKDAAVTPRVFDMDEAVSLTSPFHSLRIK